MTPGRKKGCKRAGEVGVFVGFILGSREVFRATNEPEHPEIGSFPRGGSCAGASSQPKTTMFQRLDSFRYQVYYRTSRT